MNIEIINTGTELLLGRTLNTHQQFLCSQLTSLGMVVTRQVTINDDGPSIQNAVREALQRADLIIVTGGLGPTSDDVTRDLIARLLGKELRLDNTVLAHIESFFAARKRGLPHNARVQAMVPEGAVVLANPNGTAPGLAMKVECFEGSARNAWLIMLPGPPRELRPMFTASVLPLLREQFTAQPFVCRVIHTTGLGESFVEGKIAEVLEPSVKSGLELGYCARVGEVEVRLVARGPEAEQIVNRAEEIVRDKLDRYIFGTGDVQLERLIVESLALRKQTLALAESCTGGLIANRITNVSGASAVFMAGLVTYSNEAKQRLLGVRSDTLEQHGAVSEPTAREMAQGARTLNKTDYALAVTGIAGPTGGSSGKPVGTVYVALATPDKTIVEKHFNPYDRETFKFAVSQQALDLLRRNLDQGVAVASSELNK